MPMFRDRRRASLSAVLSVIAVVALVVLTPGPASRASRASAQADGSTGVTTITGTVKVTTPFVERTITEPFMLMTDLTAFVKRDLEAPLPSPVQITGNLEGDLSSGATFTMPLPIKPEGAVNDVDNGGPGAGVQIYAVDFEVNTSGDPFLSPLEMYGWPTAITSLRVATGTNEVVGGELAVWAPDGGQAFPTDFGPDGKLFTADDPIGPIPAGWTVVDMEQHPFRLIRDDSVDVPIIEGDVALQDLSNLSYTAAFDALVSELRLRYPFTSYKHIDWDAITAEIRPLVAQAEQNGDQQAFNLAMMRFAVLMHDGHVAVEPPPGFLAQRYGGSIGVALGQTDDGKVVVRCVTPKSPAASAGIRPMAEIETWNGAPVAQAVAATEQVLAESTDRGVAEQRLTLLARMPVGTAVAIGYRNPGDGQVTAANLTAVADPAGFDQPCGLNLDDPAEMPVTVKVLPSGIGYIKVNTFFDDMTLMTHSWDWALERLRQLEVPALIVDVRSNSGGVGQLPLYFAGSFYDQPFELSQEVYVDENGKPIIGGSDEVQPSPVQWKKPVATLIGPSCASACEIFAAAMAHDPAHLIVGRTPTKGVEAAVFPWLLPGGLHFQAPLISLQNPDGSVFLEGTGVEPNVAVPNTPENLVLSVDDDAALTAAEAALQQRAG